MKNYKIIPGCTKKYNGDKLLLFTISKKLIRPAQISLDK